MLTVDSPDFDSYGWVEEYLKYQAFGRYGEVIDYSDSHGLCYLVKMDYGDRVWYDPTQLKVI